MKDLMEMFNYGMEVVEACGIETGIITDVSINTRSKKRFGQCRYNRVTDTYSINIARFILYVFRCEDCGQTIYRERMSNFVKYYKHYRCGRCGGDFQFMSNESNMQILTATGKLKMVANTGR